MKRTIKLMAKKMLAVLVLLSGDFIAMTISFIAAYNLRSWVFVNILPLMAPMQHGLEIYAGVWGILILWPLIFAYEGLYPSIGMGFWEETKYLIKGNCIVFLVLILLTFVTKTSVKFSRPIIFMAFIIAIVLLPFCRRITRLFLMALRIWTEEVILIGTGKDLKQVTCYLTKHPDVGLIPMGIITPESDNYNYEIKKIGTIENIDKINIRAGKVIVAMPGVSNVELVEIIEMANRIAPVVNVLPDLYGLASTGVTTHDLDGMLLLEMEDRLARLRNRAMKKIFDIIMSVIALIILSPIFLTIILIIKLDSKGPSIFGHKRVGKGGNTFTCFKFRTMVVNAQEVLQELLEKDLEAKLQWDQYFKLKDDPRITRVGNFLRKTSLDELPQLFNVLRGEMSLVGPRPIVEEEVERYGNKAKYFFKVTPGITGLWQVSGRNDIDYEERVMLDEYYAKNWSLWLDIEIIIRTFGAVLKKEGAY